MNPSQQSASDLGERLLELRDPLCRAELAASLLERSCASGPSDPRTWVREVREAIADVDARIEAVLAVLRGHAPRRCPEQIDAGAVVEVVLARMRPVLAARNVSAVLRSAGNTIDADDSVRLRRVLLVSLRTALAALPAGGCIELALDVVPDAIGLRTRPVADGDVDARRAGLLTDEILRPMRTMASGLGARIEVTEPAAEGHAQCCVWLPRRSQAGGTSGVAG